jgi:hypothetical protein
MTHSSPVTVHAAAPARLRHYNIPPLQWWRGEQPSELSDEVAVSVLRETLTHIAVLGLGDWRAAATGDDLAALRIALRVALQPKTPEWLLDCAGSALLACAVEGSFAAALVLAHLRRRHTTRVLAADGRV